MNCTINIMNKTIISTILCVSLSAVLTSCDEGIPREHQERSKSPSTSKIDTPVEEHTELHPEHVTQVSDEEVVSPLVDVQISLNETMNEIMKILEEGQQVQERLLNSPKQLVIPTSSRVSNNDGEE